MLCHLWIIVWSWSHCGNPIDEILSAALFVSTRSLSFVNYSLSMVSLWHTHREDFIQSICCTHRLVAVYLISRSELNLWWLSIGKKMNYCKLIPWCTQRLVAEYLMSHGELNIWWLSIGMHVHRNQNWPINVHRNQNWPVHGNCLGCHSCFFLKSLVIRIEVKWVLARHRLGISCSAGLVSSQTKSMLYF